MVVQSAPKEGPATGIGMSEQLTPRQMFCAPLLSALLFGGTAAVSTPLAKAIAQALVLVPSAN